MKVLRTIAASSLFGAGLLLASANSASAYVVCNRWGECWHTEHRYRYAPRLHIRFYDDDWYTRHHWRHRYRWRDAHEGRGYWRNGVWISF